MNTDINSNPAQATGSVKSTDAADAGGAASVGSPTGSQVGLQAQAQAQAASILASLSEEELVRKVIERASREISEEQRRLSSQGALQQPAFASAQGAWGNGAAALPVAPRRRRRNRLPGRIIRFIVWIVVVVVMIYLALMIAAWLTGFTDASGFPNVAGMIDWIRVNYNLAR